MTGFEAASPGMACCIALLWVTKGVVEDRGLKPDTFETSAHRTGERVHSHTSRWDVWRRGAGVPLLFAIWSCVDASFVVGWSLLGIAAIGRGWDLIRDGRSISSVACDRVLSRWLGLFGLAVAATFLGPNGMEWWDRARVEVVLLYEWFDSLLRLEAVVTATTLGDDWDLVRCRSTFLASAACGGVWWLTPQILRQSHQRWASAEYLLLLLSTATHWLVPHESGWFVLAWSVVLAPHLADLSKQWADRHGWSRTNERGAFYSTDSRTSASRQNRIRSVVSRTPTFASAKWDRESSSWPNCRSCLRTTWLITAARLSRLARRLFRDEKPLLFQVSHPQTAFTVLLPAFAILFVLVGTWFVGNAGAGSLGTSECFPRLRPIGVCPLYDERSVVSDAQLSRVFSHPIPTAELPASTPLLDATFQDQFARDEAIRESGLAESLATAGWLGLATDTIVMTEIGKRLISSMLRQLWREFRIGATSTKQGQVTVAGTRFEFDQSGKREAGSHPHAKSMLAFAFYLPQTREWNDADGQKVTFDRLAEQVIARVPQYDVNADDVRVELERLWSLALLLRIDDQQSLLTGKTRSRVVICLQLATSQLCETQRQDGSWSEAWWLKSARQSTGNRAATNLQSKSRATERFAALSASELRLRMTAQTLEWWALAPREALPPQDVRARAAHWLCDQLEAVVPTPSLTEAFDSRNRNSADGGDPPVVLANWVRPEFPVQDQAHLARGHVIRALALWRGRTPAAALREEQLRAKTTAAREPRVSPVD